MSAPARHPRPLVAGNWKMNGLQQSLAEATTVAAGIGADPGCDVMLCPPATLIAALAARPGHCRRRLG